MDNWKPHKFSQQPQNWPELKSSVTKMSFPKKIVFVVHNSSSVAQNGAYLSTNLFERVENKKLLKSCTDESFGKQ